MPADLILILISLGICVLIPDGQILWEASDALYTGEALPAFALAVRPYGACLALSALAAWGAEALCGGKRLSLREGLRFAAGALCLGLVLSRVLYCLAGTDYYDAAWVRRLAALRFFDGGMCMTGAIAGILIAGRKHPREAALGCPVFVFGARLAELTTDSLGTGARMGFSSFLTRHVGYTDRLNVCLIEAAAALLIFAALYLRRGRKAGLTGMPLFLFLYGVSQVLMESLRRDQHMLWGFVKAQQIAAMLMAFAGLLLAAQKRKWPRILVLSLAAAAALTALEFALDRANLPDGLLYGLYIAVLAGYAFSGARAAQSGGK